MVLQSDGKIVLAGFNMPKNTSYVDLALARFNANGTLDTSFGTGGKVTTRFASPVNTTNDIRAVNLAIDPNTSASDLDSGKLVAVVQAGSVEVARYNTNGALDTTFGTNQTGYVNVASINPAVAVQVDDRIVAAVQVPAVAGQGIALYRFNADGTQDTSFGTNGVVVTGEATGSLISQSVAILASGQIVVGGHQHTFSSLNVSFMAARYSANGSLDTTFGTNGIASAGSGLNPYNEGMALEPDGRIVLAGYTNSGPQAFYLARFLGAGPQIGSFTANPNPVTAGSSLTLTASNITDEIPSATITQVAFYYIDASGNQQFLGYGTQTGPGVWTFAFTVNLSSGSYTLLAQAEDSYGIFGDPATITLIVT